MRAREWTMLLLLALLWGGSFPFAKVAGAEIAPVALALARVAIAAAVLWVVAAAMRQVRRDAPWGALLVMGLVNNAVPFSLIFWAQTQIPAGLASILNAFTPLATILVAHVLTADERITRRKLVGIACGLAGIVILIGPGALDAAGGHPLHELAVVAATISYAFAGVFGRRFASLPPVLTAAGQLTGAAILLAPAAFLTGPIAHAAPPSTRALAATIALAVFSTALAYVLYFRILATAGATRLLLVTFMIPPVAIAIGVVALGETLAVRHFVGLAAIAAGLAAIGARPRGR